MYTHDPYLYFVNSFPIIPIHFALSLGTLKITSLERSIHSLYQVVMLVMRLYAAWLPRWRILYMYAASPVMCTPQMVPNQRGAVDLGSMHTDQDAVFITQQEHGWSTCNRRSDWFESGASHKRSSKATRHPAFTIVSSKNKYEDSTEIEPLRRPERVRNRFPRCLQAYQPISSCWWLNSVRKSHPKNNWGTTGSDYSAHTIWAIGAKLCHSITAIQSA